MAQLKISPCSAGVLLKIIYRSFSPHLKHIQHSKELQDSCCKETAKSSLKRRSITEEIKFTEGKMNLIPSIRQSVKKVQFTNINAEITMSVERLTAKISAKTRMKITYALHSY